jgi:hypothetical protein
MARLRDVDHGTQKAAALGVEVLAAVSARPDSFEIFSHPQRVAPVDAADVPRSCA